LLWQRENLVVNGGLTALASLLGGTTAGEFVAAVGFGSGNSAPMATDTALTTNPAYYNAVGAITIGPAGGVATGTVQFAYQLLTTDYAANPLTIQEMGLFGNTGGAVFPAAAGTTFANWAATTAYVAGNLIVDSNGNIQRATTISGTGTSAGAHPTWSTTINTTTTDNPGGNQIVWTLVAKSVAPVPMVAHVVVPSFPYSGGGNFSGQWSISM
jgi:hypothetical protein